VLGLGTTLAPTLTLRENFFPIERTLSGETLGDTQLVSFAVTEVLLKQVTCSWKPIPLLGVEGVPVNISEEAHWGRLGGSVG